MRREAKLLLNKACDSFLLGIELFNRPYDRGRASVALIHVDHAFEMFLKAAILHRGGRIRERPDENTIGFDSCVRRCLSDDKIRFLTEEQVLTLQTVNRLRNATQHHLLDISESQLYVHIQSAVTLFRDLLKAVFQGELSDHLPDRVLPISTLPPTDLIAIFDSEVSEILKLLQPGRRRTVEADSRLKSLAILDSTLRGKKEEPSPSTLRKLGQELLRKQWPDVFPGATRIDVVTDGAGLGFSIRLTKREGPPVQIVSEGTPRSLGVGVRRVNELGFYNLGAKDLANNLGLTVPKTIACVEHLDLKSDQDCYKEIKVGHTVHKRYSQKAIAKIEAALKIESAEEIWAKRQALRGRVRSRSAS